MTFIAVPLAATLATLIIPILIKKTEHDLLAWCATALISGLALAVSIGTISNLQSNVFADTVANNILPSSISVFAVNAIATWWLVRDMRAKNKAKNK